MSPTHGAHDIIPCPTIDTLVRELSESAAGEFRTWEICPVRRVPTAECIVRRSPSRFRQGVDVWWSAAQPRYHAGAVGDSSGVDVKGVSNHGSR